MLDAMISQERFANARAVCGMLGLALLLVGCASQPRTFERSDYAPVVPPEPKQQRVQTPTGSLFMANQTNWFGLTKASQVGDSVTIILRESTQATRSQNVNTNRESDFSFVGQVGNLVNGSAFASGLTGDSVANKLSSTGIGDSGQSASLTGSITATVMEVFANGSMLVQGEKTLTMTEGGERIRVRGIIRPDDISPRNTVFSYRLAGAEFSYEGRGDLARVARPGWGTRALNTFWPF